MEPDPRHIHQDIGGRSDDDQKDTQAINSVINKVKSQGLFDQFRKECLADVDTKVIFVSFLLLCI